MRPIRQSILHDPENGLYGNCYQAVIASLLKLPINDVPHFTDGPEPTNWKRDTNLWLAGRGLVYVELQLNDSWDEAFPGVAGLYHEIAGFSSRSTDALHSVVGLDGEVFFDPHPSEDGLIGGPENWTYGLIASLCRR